MSSLKKFLHGDTTTYFEPYVSKRILVVTLSLRHFQQQVYDLANTGFNVHKKSQSEFIVGDVLYKYLSGERMLRGSRNIDAIEMWYGAGLRPDFGELYEILQYKRASGDVKDGE